MYFVVGTVCTIYQELNLPVTSSFYDYIYYQNKKKNVSFSCTCQMDATTYYYMQVCCEKLKTYPAFLLDINECNMNMCMNGGTCVDTIGSYYCKCDQGWEGVQCEISQYSCLKVGIFYIKHIG